MINKIGVITVSFVISFSLMTFMIISVMFRKNIGSAIKKVFTYDLFNIPFDLANIFLYVIISTPTIATMYYGSMGIFMYFIFKLDWFVICTLWSMIGCAGVMFSNIYPGLFYMDDLSKPATVFTILLMGPLNIIRLTFLLFTLFMMTNTISGDNFLRLIKTRVYSWDHSDPWIQTIKRNMDVELPTIVDNVAKASRWCWKIGKTPIC
jgi:hypothetical protein